MHNFQQFKQSLYKKEALYKKVVNYINFHSHKEFQRMIIIEDFQALCLSSKKEGKGGNKEEVKQKEVYLMTDISL